MAENGSESRNEITAESILEYFLGLYKIHLGVSRDVPGEVVPVEISRHNPRLITYDLIVEQDGDKRSRRITVGPIAEDTGSKSTCFFAIYDSKLVIKIPPRPITEFNEYIECIKKDRKIVAALSPRECLIPGVSMILDKIHKFPRGNELKGNQREDIYFEWLHYNQEYQRYLKIDGNFVFFMDLSRHLFLSEVMPLFHGLETKIREEMTRDPAVLDSFEKFEGRYGIENTRIGVELKDVYSQYEDRVSRLMMQSGAGSSGILFQAQTWFFNYLGGAPAEKNDDLTEERAAGINRLLARTVEENQTVIDEYRAMIKAYLQNTRSSRHRYHQEGLVANILEMLSGIKDKGVAVRDIKPDNLLLAGDPNNYPQFLATPEKFSIGLIDLETAVMFQAEHPEAVEQPLLGGTSLYATPLNMFNNQILLEVYKDLPRSFYFQDWYAVISMIYRIIIGAYLFPRTARRFPEVAQTIIQARKTGRQAGEVILEINSTFWKSAVTEFDANLKKHYQQLHSLQIWLSDSTRAMFLGELHAENRRMDLQIRRLINRQELFKSEKNREQLYAASPGQMAGFIKKVRERPEVSAGSRKQLERIQQIKTEVRQNRESMLRLEEEAVTFSVYELLAFMFKRVVCFMNQGPFATGTDDAG